MGWQDRDWARDTPTLDYARATRPGRKGGFSIVTTIIVVNVVVFAAGVFNHNLRRWLEFNFSMLPVAFNYWEFWRLVTSQYLHAGTWHLLVNMIGLHFFGRPLEQRWSPRRFFAVYSACGVAGNIFYFILALRGVIDPLQHAVGASGSIYGLLGIIAILYPHAKLYLYFLMPIPIRWAAIGMGLIAFFTVVERGGNFGGEACHLAGLLFGVWWALHGEKWWDSTEWGLPWVKPKGGRKIDPGGGP